MKKSFYITALGIGMALAGSSVSAGTIYTRQSAMGNTYTHSGMGIRGTSRVSPMGTSISHSFNGGIRGTTRISPMGTSATHSFNNGLRGTSRVSPMGTSVRTTFSDGSRYTTRVSPMGISTRTTRDW